MRPLSRVCVGCILKLVWWGRRPGRPPSGIERCAARGVIGSHLANCSARCDAARDSAKAIDIMEFPSNLRIVLSRTLTPIVSRTVLSLLLCLGVGVMELNAQDAGSAPAGWKKYSGNPVLGGDYGTCFDLSVLKESDRYRMWFSWRPKASIALAESADGFHWSKPVIVLAPNRSSGWEEDVNRPVVIKQGGAYRMWYTGQAYGHSAIGYATSTDGVSWKRMSDKPVLSAGQSWEKAAVMCPDVIWDGEAGLYKMWYSGGEQYEPNAIGYATSRDGMTWTKRNDNPVFKADPKFEWEQNRVTGCQVVRHNGWYVMFYIGFRDIDHAQIGVARSRDGITDWQRLPDNPIVRPDPGGWDADACYKPYAIFDGEKWLLWYNGRHGGVEQIGVAIHDGRNLGF